ncbi:hypothetical protein [Serratia fonticola]|uniref:hypothetical protein n=1 Tax=Serratia fonticola TaxID=47917 RepID=UPI00093D5DD8|nr:hypothetical protein [Serratia fonticola]OKP29774.1 hypothetical protein BSQ40_08055 [Serratia fonticola]
MDKQTESREQFETWMACRFTFEPKPNFDRNIYSQERYVSFNTQRCWEAWQASRESLVVELPIGLGRENDGIQECVKSLRAIGIRIKGEGV